MGDGEATLTIGAVAAAAGINTSHIRYYERVGVLPEPVRVAGRRVYGRDVLHRLAIVGVAQRAGFTLDEIRDLTGAHAGGAGERIRALAERKLPDVDALIERAQAVRRWLDVASRCDCDSVDVCGLFVDPRLAPPPAGPLDVVLVAPRRAA